MHRTGALRVRPGRHDDPSAGPGRSNELGQAAPPVGKRHHAEDGEAHVERRVLDLKRLPVHHPRLASGHGLEALAQPLHHAGREIGRESTRPRPCGDRCERGRAGRDVEHALAGLNPAGQRQASHANFAVKGSAQAS
jgi:hypothetical protein